MDPEIGNRNTAAAIRYHEDTKHSQERLRRDRHQLDWPNQPLAFKIYRGLESVELITDADVLGATTSPVITTGATPPTHDDDTSGEQIPDLAGLSRFLYLSAGITKRRRYPGGEFYFRAYPNTGALYHIDLYLVTGDLSDLAAGVYHFGANDFTLKRLRTGDYRAEVAEAAGGHPRVVAAPVIVISASTYWRNAWKYRARTYRHCFWDSGTLHANLLAVGESEGFDPCIVVGFVDARIESLLALDPAKEGALTLVPLGRTRKALTSAPTAPPLRLETEPLSRHEVEYPQIPAMHAASSLPDGAEVSAWRGRTPSAVVPSAAGPTVPLRPRADSPDDSLGDVIRRRGSTRAFDPSKSITFEALSSCLDYSTRVIPADFLDPPERSLLHIYLIVHAVEGLCAGSYYYRRSEGVLELLQEGDFRATAGHLGLSQELPAEAAVNVYSMCHLDPNLERFGNRGYRAAQLEGGIVGGRLYLSAYAQRFGATGLTFFDDEVTDFFCPHGAGKSVMFLNALGYPHRSLLRR